MVTDTCTVCGFFLSLLTAGCKHLKEKSGTRGSHKTWQTTRGLTGYMWECPSSSNSDSPWIQLVAALMWLVSSKYFWKNSGRFSFGYLLPLKPRGGGLCQYSGPKDSQHLNTSLQDVFYAACLRSTGMIPFCTWLSQFGNIAQGQKEGIIIVFLKEGSFECAHKITGVIVISC